jgi:uncharacterized coiled-coil DUF342 family protein
MPQFSPAHQNAGCQTSTEAARILQLEQENEILREQILTLEHQLQDNAQQLLEMEQELEHTNNEMGEMNRELLAVLESESLTLAQAIEVAKIIGLREKSAFEPLAELLSAIYGSTVEASALNLEEMPQTELSGARTNEIRLDELMSRVREQKTRAKELRAQLTAVWERREVIRAQTASIIAQHRELKQRRLALIQDSH